MSGIKLYSYVNSPAEFSAACSLQPSTGQYTGQSELPQSCYQEHLGWPMKCSTNDIGKLGEEGEYWLYRTNVALTPETTGVA